MGTRQFRSACPGRQSQLAVAGLRADREPLKGEMHGSSPDESQSEKGSGREENWPTGPESKTGGL